jgi:hypothetical protein
VVTFASVKAGIKLATVIYNLNFVQLLLSDILSARSIIVWRWMSLTMGQVVTISV